MIKIYQINPEKDINKVAFRNYSWIVNHCNFDFSIYDEVWSGEEPDECGDLEEIYEVFNLYPPKDFEGHSLSVSDIVQIIGSDEESNGYYYCDTIGFERLNNKLCKHDSDSCMYCRDYSLHRLPLKANLDISLCMALIAQGDKKHEIVIDTKDGCMGIEINYCPMCGKKL